MISKKRALAGALLIFFVTGILTFVISNNIQISLNQKVILTQKDYNELVRAYEKYSKNMVLESFIKENFLNDIDEERLLEGQLKGMFESLEDPYSVYMTQDEFKDFMEHTAGSYGGIGVIVTPGDDNFITVVSPIEDTPGEIAGIKTGDKIVKVNGVEYTADKMDDAIKIMKGEPGTDVTLTLLRREKNGETRFIDLNITREEIRLKSVKSQMLPDNIGYIRINSFDELTYKDFEAQLEELEKKELKGIVLDLRNNPGGLLDVSAEIADEFLGEGVIVYTETKDKQREYLNSDKNKIDVPVVVLVNEGSASASEILSGALKDTKVGTIIGTKTFGKGIVQRIKQLPDESGFKITVSKYYTPNGTSIHGVGITPDIVIELPEGVEEIGVENLENDVQLKKAIEVLKSKLQ